MEPRPIRNITHQTDPKRTQDRHEMGPRPEMNPRPIRKTKTDLECTPDRSGIEVINNWPGAALWPGPVLSKTPKDATRAGVAYVAIVIRLCVLSVTGGFRQNQIDNVDI